MANWIEERMNQQAQLSAQAVRLWFMLKDELRNDVSIYEARVAAMERLIPSFAFNEAASTITVGVAPMSAAPSNTNAVSVALVYGVDSHSISVKKYYSDPVSEQVVGSLQIALDGNGSAILLMDGKPMDLGLISRLLLEPMFFQRA